MTLGALSREESGAGCSGRAEKPKQRHAARLNSFDLQIQNQLRCSLMRSDQASSKAEITNTT